MPSTGLKPDTSFLVRGFRPFCDRRRMENGIKGAVRLYKRKT